jgi:thiol-disulfide isomerase/thioredoxin
MKLAWQPFPLFMLYIAFMRFSSIRAVAFAVLTLAVAARAGDAAPPLELHDLKGSPHKLQDYRGKPVVLNFWATWCVPCAAEMPLLSEMQARYKGKVIFVAVSVDDEDMKPTVEAFIRKHKVSALMVMMGASLDNLHDFGLQDVMPGTVFIDEQGNIVDRLSGKLKRQELEERLKKLAGEPAPPPAAKKHTKKQSS